MDRRPLFSIITVSYQNLKTLKECVQSVLDQSFSGFEYLIIDGGSTDGTKEFLQQLPETVQWISEPDQGIYDAMNKGWQMAKGQFVAYLNADDVYHNEAVLEKVAQSLHQNPETWALYGDLAYVKADNLNAIVRYWQSGHYSRKAFTMGWMPPHPTFFLRREAFEKFGGFRQNDLRSAADYELMLRMLFVHHLPAVYCPHLLVRMRTGGESNRNFKNRVRGNREDRKAWELNQLKPGFFTLILKPLRKIPQYWQRPENEEI